MLNSLDIKIKLNFVFLFVFFTFFLLTFSVQASQTVDVTAQVSGSTVVTPSGGGGGGGGNYTPSCQTGTTGTYPNCVKITTDNTIVTCNQGETFSRVSGLRCTLFVTNLNDISTGQDFKGKKKCKDNVLLTQNLKAGIRDGKYSSYTKGIVKEAKILQMHLNRLGFSSGKEDGIIGIQTDAAIKRMQIFFKVLPDGLIGPVTRNFINNSCN